MTSTTAEEPAAGTYVPGAIFGSLMASAAEPVASKKKQNKKAKSDGDEEVKASSGDDDLFAKSQSSLKATVTVAPMKAAPKADSKRRGGEDSAKKRTRKDETVEEEEDGAESESEEEIQKDDEKNGRTIFVGNVPIRAFQGDEATAIKTSTALKKLEKALKKHFSEYGKVESVRLRSLGLKSLKVPSGSDFHLVRKVAAVKGSLDDRLDTCNAFVVFEGEDSVASAVEKADGQMFYGNHLRVDSVKSGGEKGKVFDRKRTVFVGNLAFEASEEECRAHFADKLGQEAVKSVRIIRNKMTNLGQGIAYVLLSDRSMVPKAIAELDGSKLRDRAIRVNKCQDTSDNKQAGGGRKRRGDGEDRSAKKPRRSFAGKEASDPTEIPGKKTRRKKITEAQKKAYKKESGPAKDDKTEAASGSEPSGSKKEKTQSNKNTDKAHQTRPSPKDKGKPKPKREKPAEVSDDKNQVRKSPSDSTAPAGAKKKSEKKPAREK